MKTVMFYEIGPEALPKATAYFAAHRARLQEFHARGVLLMAGAFANSTDGAMVIFTTRKDAEEFIKGDPFVIHGIIGKWKLREWDEAFT
jgi:hypothetical protein